MLITKNEKLKKISDSVFQEAEPPEDRNRPLEWRRRFNFIHLPLKNLKIVNRCTVHEIKFNIDKENSTNPVELVRPNLTSRVGITATLDEDQVRDSIYFAVENEEEKGIYSIERAKGETEITLISGQPTEGVENIPAGLYWGNAFRLDFEPGQDQLCFELAIPEEQMNSIIKSLREDEKSTVEIGAHLLSFTFEVDDALREPYHPRDIVINEPTLCFLSWAGVTSKVGTHYKKPDLVQEEDEKASQYKEELTQEQRSLQDLKQALLSYSKPLNSLVRAAWALIIIIALYALLD